MSNTIAYEAELELENEFEQPVHNEMESENFGGSNGHSPGSYAPYERRNEQAHYEFETETEGEQFSFSFKKFFKKAAPFLKTALKIAAPAIGTAIGGPAGGLIGGAASSLLRESEAEGEFESQFDRELESELEGELEAPRGGGRSSGTPRQNWMPEDYAAEAMAAMASKTESEAESEAIIGAATAAALSRSDDARIRALMPYLVNGAAVLCQAIRKQPQARPLLRALPEIARLTHRELSRRVLSGRPVNRKTAARAFYQQAQEMLTDPRLCGNPPYRNIRAQREFARAL